MNYTIILILIFIFGFLSRNYKTGDKFRLLIIIIMFYFAYNYYITTSNKSNTDIIYSVQQKNNSCQSCNSNISVNKKPKMYFNNFISDYLRIENRNFTSNNNTNNKNTSR